MFKKYTKLSDILKDSSNFIFVDEYQDTSPLIKEILLTHASNNNKKNLVVFMPTDNPTIIKNAEKLFGKDNIIDGDKLSKE